MPPTRPKHQQKSECSQQKNTFSNNLSKPLIHKPLVEYDNFSSSEEEERKTKKIDSADSKRKVVLKSVTIEKAAISRSSSRVKSTHSNKERDKDHKNNHIKSSSSKSERRTTGNYPEIDHRKSKNQRSRSRSLSSFTSSDFSDGSMDRHVPLPPGSHDIRRLPSSHSPVRNVYHERGSYSHHQPPLRYDRERSPHSFPMISQTGFSYGHSKPNIPIIRRSLTPPKHSIHCRSPSKRRDVYTGHQLGNQDGGRSFRNRSKSPIYGQAPSTAGNQSGMHFTNHDVDNRKSQHHHGTFSSDTNHNVGVSSSFPLSDDPHRNRSRDRSSSHSRSRHHRRKHKKKSSSRKKHSKYKSSRRRSRSSDGSMCDRRRSSSRSQSSQTSGDESSQASEHNKKKSKATLPEMTVGNLAAKLSESRKKLAAEIAGSTVDEDQDHEKSRRRSKKKRKEKKAHKERKKRGSNKKRTRDTQSDSIDDEEKVTPADGSVENAESAFDNLASYPNTSGHGINPDVLVPLASQGAVVNDPSNRTGNNIPVTIVNDVTTENQTSGAFQLQDRDYRIDRMMAEQSRQAANLIQNIPTTVSANLITIKQEESITSSSASAKQSLPDPPHHEVKSTDTISRVKTETPSRSRRLHDLPLPPVLPVVSKSEEDPVKTPPSAIEKEQPRKKRPRLCGPRTREVTQRVNDWGSMCVDEYDVLSITGEGTFGQVYKAKEKRTGDVCALKKVRLDNEREGFPITAVREIKILRQLQHPNIVCLKDVLTDKSNATDFRREKECAFYLVFEYMDHDLMGLLESGLVHFNEGHIKSFMRQLLDGLNHCHKKGFLHRDIKCSNILLNNKGEIKLADFGLARFYNQDEPRPYTNRVITLWYRPPELLLGEETYTPAIDIWSCGCILAELFTKKPLFQADREIAQLECISSICGSPIPAVWPDVIKLPHFHTMKPKRQYRRRLREEFAFLPTLAIDLLDQILTLDPSKRFTAEEALNCPWLRNVDVSTMSMPEFPHWQDCHEMWSKKRRKEKRENARRAAEGKPPIHSTTNEPSKAVSKASSSNTSSSSKDVDMRHQGAAKSAPKQESVPSAKNDEQDALLKLIQDNPDMNLAQLAKAWNVPIDGESVKFLSTVNIKVLVSALNQKPGEMTSGASGLMEQLQKFFAQTNKSATSTSDHRPIKDENQPKSKEASSRKSTERESRTDLMNENAKRDVDMRQKFTGPSSNGRSAT